MSQEKNGMTNGVQEVFAEEVSPDKTGSVIVLDSAEHLIGVELKKFDTNKEKIAELKTLYSPLKINGEEDKAGYEEVRKAVAVLRPLRTGVDKTRKAAKEKYLKTGQGIDKYAKELTELIEEIENPLKAMLDEIDNAKEKRRIEAEQALAAKTQERKEILLANGMSYDGNAYRIEFEDRFQVASDSELSFLEDNQFESLLNTVKAIKGLIDEAKEKAEKEAEENRKAVQKQQQEIAEMKAERRKLRSMAIESMGFVYSLTRSSWIINNRAVSDEIPFADLGEMNGAEWEEFETKATNLSKQAAKALSELEQSEKAEAEAKEKFELRAKRLVGLGLQSDGEQLCYKDINFRNTDILSMSDDEFESEFKAAAERMENIKAEEAKEAQEKAKQEEFERKQLEVLNTRISFLKGKGFDATDIDLCFYPIYSTEKGLVVTFDELKVLDEEGFNSLVGNLEAGIEKIKQADQEVIDQRAKELEAKRQSFLSDGAKIKEWIEKVRAVEVPELQNEELKQAVNIMIEGLIGLEQMVARYES